MTITAIFAIAAIWIAAGAFVAYRFAGVAGSTQDDAE